MESWERELRGVQSGSEWKGGDKGKAVEELELTKMDTLIMQVSKMARSVAEVRESCLCLEELISMEEKEQTELRSLLKTPAINPLGGHQHSITEANLQASTLLLRDHIEGGDKENEMLEEELIILIKKLLCLKESKRTKLKDIKDHYGHQVLYEEENDQQKRIVDLRYKKNVLSTSILNLKQEKNRRTQEEWSNFTKVVINMTELQYMIKNSCKTLQQHKATIKILETADHSRRQGEFPPVVEDTKQASIQSLPSSSHTLQCTKSQLEERNNSSWNLQKDDARTVDPSGFEESPQIISSLSCSQAQLVETSHCLFKNHSHNTASSEATVLPLKCHHNSNRGRYHIWNKSAAAKNVSPLQGSTSNLRFSNSSFSEIFSPVSKDMSCSTFVSQTGKGPLSSSKTLSISPQVYRGLKIASQKFKSVRVPLSEHKSADVRVSRDYESPHINFRGVVAPCLSSMCKRVPPPSRGNRKPICRSVSVYSQFPHKKSSKSNDPTLPDMEISGSSVSAKNVIYKEELQERQASTDCTKGKPASPSDNNDNGSHFCTKASMSISSSPSGPSSNAFLSNQDDRTPSILQTPMEVDKHGSVKVASPVPILDISSEACRIMCTEPANTKDTLHISKGSQKSSTTTISTTEDCKVGRQSSCIPAIAHSSPSSTSPCHLMRNEWKKSESLKMKSSLTPSADLDHTLQGFSNRSTTGESPGIPLMFQRGSQANSGEHLQFNLFGSSLGESSAHVSARNLGSSLFTLENLDNSRTEGSTSGLFNFDLGSDGDLTEHSDSSFFSSLYDTSLETNNSSNETSGFHLF